MFRQFILRLNIILINQFNDLLMSLIFHDFSLPPFLSPSSPAQLIPEHLQKAYLVDLENFCHLTGLVNLHIIS